ncbi:MAG: protein kinase [Opitutaceae bacterium]|nr:protein kinase [Opitutaceae bacterium]
MTGENQPAPPVIPDYELVRPIGRGSYGDVWLARGVTGVWRAIKLVWRERFEDTGPFEREFKGLKEFAEVSLGESIQMALLHVGRNEAAGFFYYVMELADDAERGRAIEPASYVPLTLAELRTRRGRLPTADCVRFGVELARVLAGLHRRGLVHRDIKPSNVILVGGVPKLADIGLVAPVASARTFIGTEGYVPPEGPGAPSADVFALGKVLYELATGLDRQEFPQLPAELNRLPDHRALLALNEIILRACDPQPQRRYRDGAALLADLAALQAGRSPAARRVRRSLLVYGAAAAGLIALVVVAAGRGRPAPAPAPAPVAATPSSTTAAPAFPPISNKSIAVLPFANMSDEKDANAFFADGVHEDIVTNLALIAELRVVSRTSVMQYRATTKPIKQIGADLGVAYLLEGSVRRVGNRVRVTGQLINARTDEHVWAKSYDRELTDIFAIQAALAAEIATALSAAISPEARQQIVRRPTENSAAYDLFLQGRDIRNRAPTSSRAALAHAEQRFADAVKLDPGFAAAWGELAVVHALNVFWFRDASAERKAQGAAAIAQAVRLAPDSLDVIRLAGTHAYHADRDYVRATAAYDKIVRLQPHDPTGYASLGLIQRRQGRWAEALANLRRAVDLDPANLPNLRHLASTLFWVRRWDEAFALGRRIIALLPGQLAEELYLANAESVTTGSLQRADELLARLTPTQRESPMALHYRKSWAIRRDDYAEFKRLDALQPYYPELMHTAHGTIDSATMHLAHGDVPAARAHRRIPRHDQGAVGAGAGQSRAPVPPRRDGDNPWAPRRGDATDPRGGGPAAREPRRPRRLGDPLLAGRRLRPDGRHGWRHRRPDAKPAEAEPLPRRANPHASVLCVPARRPALRSPARRPKERRTPVLRAFPAWTRPGAFALVSGSTNPTCPHEHARHSLRPAARR